MVFDDLYDFAGKLRSVNISKGGFVFPASRFLFEAIKTFETEFLIRLSEPFDSRKEFITTLARSHAELLFIHPFREGNGRTARLLANLVSIRHLGEDVDFTTILRDNKDQYILAVQQASGQEYDLMEKLFIRGLS